jgi:hypothetical protein
MLMRSACLLLVIVGLLLLLALGGFLLLTYRELAPLSEAADAFLTRVGTSQYEEAYTSTSEAYRTAVPRERFVAAMRELQIDRFASASWKSRTRDGVAGRVTGTFTTRDGSAVPLTVQLVLEDEVWRVSHLGREAESSAPVTPPVPRDEALRELVMETLRAFLAAVQARDFTAFSTRCSGGMQSSHTPEELATAFEACLEGTLDVRCILSEAPELEVPGAGEGTSPLQVICTFPEGRLQVELSYVPEGGRWMLGGIGVAPTPGAERLPMPDPEELLQLVEGTLLAFNRAVVSKDFTAFHASLAEPLRLQSTPASWLEDFSQFVEQGIDFSGIEGEYPVLPATELTESGILEVTGMYLEQGLQFELAFLPEGGSWKVYSIQVRAME